MGSLIDDGTVFLTGASAGIGLELARQLAPRARTLILLARRRERLEELAAELTAANPRLRVIPVVADLADLDATRVAVDEALATSGPVDVLINNAGLGDQALFERSRWSAVEAMVRVNVIAPTWLLHRMVPDMVARGRGGVLNVSSGAALAPMAGGAVYSATKAFLHGLGEALGFELEGTGVQVTEVLPGPVSTEFDQVAGMTVHNGLDAFLIDAARCARDSLAGFDAGRRLVYPGRAYRVLMSLQPMLPHPMVRRMARPTVRALRGAGAGALEERASG